jgi:NAD(P)-dependent dehydrogenase (short-subunit alcohol dehydrogenase family)
MSKSWFITGVSTGLGRSLMEAALARGDTVVGTLRNMAARAGIEALAPGRAHVVELDVDDAARAGPAIAEAMALLGGRLDILVNNAAVGSFGPLEECPDEDYRRVMETNFFGLIRVTRAALPHLRASRGMIVNFSSVAGLVGHAGTGPYNASKFAVEGLSESLAQEVAAFGVKVMLVNPDAFKSAFFADRAEHVRASADSVYAGRPGGTIGQQLDAFVGNEPGDPAKLAQLVLAAVDSPNPPFRLLVGASAFGSVEAKITQLQADMAAWRAAASDTYF